MGGICIRAVSDLYKGQTPNTILLSTGAVELGGVSIEPHRLCQKSPIC